MTGARNIAAVGLTAVLIIIVAGVCVLAWDGADVPDVLQIVAGAAVGALATLATGANTVTDE